MTAHERRLEREKKARYRAKHRGTRCLVCCGPKEEHPTFCHRCRAYYREWRLPEYAHDLAAHAEMLRLACREDSRCAASGLTLAELRALGTALEVDRIDADLGYVPGNMQLLAAPLNRHKWRFRDVPRFARESLLSAHRFLTDPSYVPEPF